MVVGAAGQDGSYLTERLITEGGAVIGLIRPGALAAARTVLKDHARLNLMEVDLLSQVAVERAVADAAPDHVYNLAGESFMPATWENPVETADVAGLGAVRILEALRRRRPSSRYLQASSPEIFGRLERSPQDETTPIRPTTPYGAARAYAHFMTAAYRERHGLFAINVILYNHESPRRRPEFVTRKIARAAARAKLGLEKELRLGDIDARRDWSFAGDVVEAMTLAVRHSTPEDFVVAGGKTRSVGDFAAAAYRAVGLDWRAHVVADASLRRSGEGAERRGDAAKARRLLGWSPKTSFEKLVGMMVEAELSAGAL
jgi:GDPmannose 4,6-dehydratase